MMTQLVPLEYNVHQAPSVAGRIAVPAVALSIGATLEDAETTDCAWIVLNQSVLPSVIVGSGRVTVTVPARSKINLLDYSVTV
jgi:hypothetical protein